MNKFDRITPEGTRDALFAECTLRRQIENRLHGLFTARGKANSEYARENKCK